MWREITQTLKHTHNCVHCTQFTTKFTCAPPYILIRVRIIIHLASCLGRGAVSLLQLTDIGWLPWTWHCRVATSPRFTLCSPTRDTNLGSAVNWKVYVDRIKKIIFSVWWRYDKRYLKLKEITYLTCYYVIM